MKNTRSPRVILIAAAASVLLLAGCATPADEPAKPVKPVKPAETALVEPKVEKLEAPTSAEEAISGASAVLKEYMTLRSDAFVDPTKVDALDEVSVGQALDRVKQEARQAGEKGLEFTGEFGFEFLRGAAGSLKTASGDIEFGSVTVTGCYDMTAMSVKRADGKESENSSVLRFEVAPLVVFDQKEGRWVVYEWTPATEVVEC